MNTSHTPSLFQTRVNVKKIDKLPGRSKKQRRYRFHTDNGLFISEPGRVEIDKKFTGELDLFHDIEDNVYGYRKIN